MQNSGLFRWTFTGCGLWLMLSPFLLLGGQLAFGTDIIGDAGTLLMLGFAALITASYSFSKHHLMQSACGFSLGSGLVAAAWLSGFTDPVATWNAGIIGMVLAVVGLRGLVQHRPRHIAI